MAVVIPMISEKTYERNLFDIFWKLWKLSKEVWFLFDLLMSIVLE